MKKKKLQRRYRIEEEGRESKNVVFKKKEQKRKNRGRACRHAQYAAAPCTVGRALQTTELFVPSTSLPSISTPVVASSRTGSIPYMGKQQLPGLAGVTAGKGVSK